MTNNRGAVGKVVRDMGVVDGLPYEGGASLDGVDGDKTETKESPKAVVWIVNPSSLSEWRRLEVVESNRRLLEVTAGQRE